jgi:hypothetical protein
MFSGLLMMVGLAIIDARGLYYFKKDFPTIPEHEKMTRFPAALGWIPHVPAFRLLGFWFAASLVYSVYCARKKKISMHRSFMYRHIGAGIWVALQRIYVFVAAQAGFASTPADQKMNFGDGAVFGALCTIFLAEVAAWASVRQQVIRSKSA